MGQMEMSVSTAFTREHNESGFRQAVNYLSGEMDIDLSTDERHSQGLKPVIIIESSDGVTEFYDASASNRQWYTLEKSDDGYTVTDKGALDDTTRIAIRAGETVSFGMVKGDVTKNVDEVFEPLRANYAEIRAGVGTHRRRGLGRLATIFGK